MVVVSPPFGRLRAGFRRTRAGLRRVRGERRRRQLGRIEAGWLGGLCGQPDGGGGGQVSAVCGRCVLFRRQCVQFSPECVHFSGKCVQSAAECVQSGLTTPPSRQAQRGGSWAVSRLRPDGVLSPQAVNDGFGVGRRRESKGCSPCWRRSVQFLPQCVHFSGQCVQFPPLSAPDVFTFQADVFSRG